MSNILQGTVSGIIFGIGVVLLMLPMSFPDKRAALLSAFFSRFAVGFLVGITVLPTPSWARGLLIGFLVSLPEAIITKSYAPILVIGCIGGAIIGLIIG